MTNASPKPVFPSAFCVLNAMIIRFTNNLYHLISICLRSLFSHCLWILHADLKTRELVNKLQFCFKCISVTLHINKEIILFEYTSMKYFLTTGILSCILKLFAQNVSFCYWYFIKLQIFIYGSVATILVEHLSHIVSNLHSKKMIVLKGILPQMIWTIHARNL